MTLALVLCIALCSCDLVIATGPNPKNDAAALYREGFSKLNPEESINVRIAFEADGQTVEMTLAYVFDENGEPSVSLTESIIMIWSSSG